MSQVGRRTGGDAPRSLWSAVASTAAAKIFVMGLSGVLGIITSRIIISNFGVDAYAQYGLLSGLPALLPFADLGIAAVVINAIAGSNDPKRDEYVRHTITSALRILIVSGSVIALVSFVIYLAGWWPAILGEGLMPDGGSLSAFLCLAIFGFVLPLSVGQRILVGLHKTNVQIATQSIVAPIMLLVIGTGAALALPMAAYLPVVSYIANGTMSAVCLIIAARALRPQVGSAFRDILKLRQVRSVPVFHLAWPMLVQMIALPIAMQTDRILLSHLAPPASLAEYNLASQLFGIVLQTIAAAGLSLWPHFAKARSQSRVESPIWPTLWFIGGGIVLASALALISPWLASFISDGKIQLGLPLVLWFVIFVALQAAKYPVGMYMTDERGLKFQVIPIVLMMPISLGLSWWLIGVIGAAGAIAGSAIAVLLCQVIPNVWYVQADLVKRRKATEATGE